MTVNKLAENRVLIILGGEEMKSYNLEFEKLSFENSHSRRVMLRLIQVACRKSGIATVGKSVSVEALMLSEGCYLLMTVEHKTKSYRLKKSSGICCKFENTASLMNAAEALYREGFCCTKNSLYEANGEYYIIFDYPALPLAINRIISEYSSVKRNSVYISRIKESCKLVCANSAIQQIGAHLV